MKRIKQITILGLSTVAIVAHANQIMPITGWALDENDLWRVEIVNDKESRAKGLMFRPYLLPNAGMLFVFDQPQAMSFWMKNTWLALDIRFYDENGRLITHYPYAAPCLTNQCKQYHSEGAVKYVLETASAFRINQRASDLRQIIVSQ